MANLNLTSLRVLFLVPILWVTAENRGSAIRRRSSQSLGSSEAELQLTKMQQSAKLQSLKPLAMLDLCFGAKAAQSTACAAVTWGTPANYDAEASAMREFFEKKKPLVYTNKVYMARMDTDGVYAAYPDRAATTGMPQVALASFDGRVIYLGHGAGSCKINDELPWAVSLKVTQQSTTWSATAKTYKFKRFVTGKAFGEAFGKMLVGLGIQGDTLQTLDMLSCFSGNLAEGVREGLVIAGHTNAALKVRGPVYPATVTATGEAGMNVPGSCDKVEDKIIKGQPLARIILADYITLGTITKTAAAVPSYAGFTNQARTCTSGSNMCYGFRTAAAASQPAPTPSQTTPQTTPAP